MRRRILISTLLVVAVTVTVLGGPLVFTTWRLVEDFTHAEINTRLRQVVRTLDVELSVDRPVDLSPVAVAVPPGGSLVVRTPGGVSAIGDTGNEPVVTETLPFGVSGSAVLSEPAAGNLVCQFERVGSVPLCGDDRDDLGRDEPVDSHAGHQLL